MMLGDLRCPVCLGRSLALAGKLAHMSVFRCKGCRLEISDSALRQAAGEEAWASHETSTATSSGYREAMLSRGRSLQDSVRRLAAGRLSLYSGLLGRKPASILEIGSGAGWLVKAYQELGIPCLGFEIDQGLVSMAQENGANVLLEDICGINTDLLPKHDVVFSSQTLEHVLYPRTAISKIKLLASSGGLVHIDVPNAASWGGRIRRLRRGGKRWGVLEPPHHQIGYYPGTLTCLLQDVGLEVIQICERPTNDPVYGQSILPAGFLPKAAMFASHWLGHGYILVGLARVPSSQGLE